MTKENELAGSSVQTENERLRAKVERFRQCGMAELAASNQNAMEYVKHWEGRTHTAEARVTKLEAALERQGDNMAFVINHATLPEQWMAKFMAELAEDRAALERT